jgi:hypothetical protein
MLNWFDGFFWTKFALFASQLSCVFLKVVCLCTFGAYRLAF